MSNTRCAEEMSNTERSPLDSRTPPSVAGPTLPHTYIYVRQHAYCTVRLGSHQSLCASQGKRGGPTPRVLKATSPDFHELTKIYPANSGSQPRRCMARAFWRPRPKSRAHQNFPKSSWAEFAPLTMTGGVPRRHDSACIPGASLAWHRIGITRLKGT